jgi:hypothetical protein
MKKHILQENYERFFEKREFGDPLPTFEDVMKKHQVNKFKEDLDSVDKEDDDVDNDGDSDASDDYLKNRRDVISKAIETESIKEGWWDNMSDAAKKSYIKKHGSAPNVAGDDDYDMGEVPGSRELDDTPEDDSEKGSSLTSAPGRVPDEEPSGEEKPSGWSQKAQKAKDDLEQLSDPDEIGDWIEDNKWSLSGGKLGRAADLEFAPVQKAYAELEDAYMEGDWDVYDKAKEDFTKLTNQKLDSQKVSRSRRTGKELDQETLTIDGNQYRRINEGVEQKPKYTFSEFYQRFKR